MADKLGKKFESKFKEDFLKSLPGSTVDRLIDSMTHYYNVSNICDFIGYKCPNIYYIECKTHAHMSIPFDKITQYDKLVEKVGIEGARVGVVLWLYEKDWVAYIPISTITKMKKDGKKSVGIKSLEEGYNIIEIPSVKLRTFMDSDYSVLLNLKDGE